MGRIERQIKLRHGGKYFSETGHGRLRWPVGLLAVAVVALTAGICVGMMLGDKKMVAVANAPLPSGVGFRPEESQRAPTVFDKPPTVNMTARDIPLAAAQVVVAVPKPNRVTLVSAQRLWDENAVAYSVPPGTPLIAIVLDDMGLDRIRSERATRLTAPLTLSYLSYANDLTTQTGAARARGHELMLHLPMEPEGDADPGPGALLLNLSDGELRKRIDFALSRFPGFVAVNNHMGSRFTADRSRMRLVFEAIRSSGHLFLDSLTTPNAVSLSLGPKMGVPTLGRDVFLDDVDTEDEVWFRLLKAEQIAETQGTAIAIGHPRDATLAVLEDWIKELEKRSAKLAPLSAIGRVRLGDQYQAMTKP